MNATKTTANDPRCVALTIQAGRNAHVTNCRCDEPSGDPSVYEAADECEAALTPLTGIQRNCVLNILKIRGVLP